MNWIVYLFYWPKAAYSNIYWVHLFVDRSRDVNTFKYLLNSQVLYQLVLYVYTSLVPGYSHECIYTLIGVLQKIKLKYINNNIIYDNILM